VWQCGRGQQFGAVDVVAAVSALPNKQCASDPHPTSWLKGNVDLLASFFVELFNQSLSVGYVPAAFREAYITPLLKKADLDSADARSYNNKVASFFYFSILYFHTTACLLCRLNCCH